MRTEEPMLKVTCDRCGDIQIRGLASTEGGWLNVKFADGTSQDLCPVCHGHVLTKKWRPGIIKATLALGLIVITLTGTGVSQSDAHHTRTCPYAMGEPCPAHYGHDLCNSLVYDLATAADVYDVDYVMHSAGCHQVGDGTWKPARHASDPADAKCSRRAYHLLGRGYSILRLRQMLFVRGCAQFEDGTYDAR